MFTYAYATHLSLRLPACLSPVSQAPAEKPSPGQVPGHSVVSRKQPPPLAERTETVQEAASTGRMQP